MMKNDQFSAFFFILNILLFTLLPFGSATHDALLRSSPRQITKIDLNDLNIKLEKILKGDIYKLKDMVNDNLNLLKDQDLITYLKSIFKYDLKDANLITLRKIRGIIDQFVSKPEIQQKFQTDHKRLLQILHSGFGSPENKIDVSDNEILDGPGIFVLSMYCGIFWFYVLRFQLSLTRQMIDRYEPFKQRLIAHSITLYIQVFMGLMVSIPLSYSNSNAISPALPVIISLIPGLLVTLLDYNDMIPGTSGSFRLLAPRFLQRWGRDDNWDDSSLEMVEIEFNT